jgi:hypothetical protein
MQNQSYLSPKQARFATAYAQHHNASLAAREAGYSAGCASVTGTRLLANDSVFKRIQALEALNAVELGVSRQRLLDELQEAAVLAKAKQEPMAMIAAWREIGKICGFYAPERIKLAVSTEWSAEMGRMEKMTDSELIKLIALSPE